MSASPAELAASAGLFAAAASPSSRGPQDGQTHRDGRAEDHGERAEEQVRGWGTAVEPYHCDVERERRGGDGDGRFDEVLDEYRADLLAPLALFWLVLEVAGLGVCASVIATNAQGAPGDLLLGAGMAAVASAAGFSAVWLRVRNQWGFTGPVPLSVLGRLWR